MRPRPVILGVLIALALGGGIVALLTIDRGDDHPSEWDPRVADLAAFVEEERELDFEHPVHVDFLDDEEFNEIVTTDEGTLTEEEKEEIEVSAATMRALGLIGGDVDVLDAFNQLNEVGILALYDHEKQRVRVKGTEMSAGLRATLVHELTHALQDQHFGIAPLIEIETETESSTPRAILEGDANMVMNAYLETLDDDERAEVEEEEAAAGDQVQAADLPPVLEVILGAPYVLGEPLVSAIVESEGLDALNEALQDPPRTDEPLLDPFGYLADPDEAPVDVAVPELGDDEEEVHSGVWGSLGWYVMLAQRIDARAALEATDGWGGDAYVVYRRDDTICVRIDYRGDTAGDTAELADALADWTAEMPDGAAEVERRGRDGLSLQSCDPGDDASVPDDLTVDAILTPAIARAVIGLQVLTDGASAEEARCMGTEFVLRLTDEQLASEELDPETTRIVTGIVGRCRAA